VVYALENDPEAVMSTAATEILSQKDFISPQIVKVVLDNRSRALYFSRSSIPFSNTTYKGALQHIGIYCYRKYFLKKYTALPASHLQILEDLEQLKVLENGYKISVTITKEIAIGIDTPEDLEKFKERING
jgi:3-deoxy-manno-octulosonate cytidylyltransferase (CMP-KDO synthetase)